MPKIEIDLSPIIDSDNGVEYFMPTFNLRWKLLMCPKPRKILEQMWQGNNGTEKWEEIEIVKDGSHKTRSDVPG